MTRVVHVINGLGMGGAENMLVRLLERVDQSRFETTVVSLGPDLALAPRLRDAGVEVVGLAGADHRSTALVPFRLRRELRRLRPDLVETWLYKADLVGGLVARSGLATPVVWSIRQTSLDSAASTRSNRAVARVCARLSSRVPRLILCVSEEALEAHASSGYDRSRMRVIPNGFDLDRFRANPDAARAVRSELGLTDELVIGLVARVDPQKDQLTFLDALGRVVRRRPGVVALLCGNGCTSDNAELGALIDKTSLRDHVRLLGVRPDVERVTAALDLAVSSSAFGEGFSNSLGEALACGVPAVATETGNAVSLLDGVGWVVPTRNPESLAAAIDEALDEPADERAARVERGLERIRNFSLDRIVERYQQAWEGAAQCAAS